MRRLLHYLDKIVLALCVMLLLASAVWAAMSFKKIEDVAALNATGFSTPATYEAHPVQMPQIALVSWPEPPAQSPPRRWIYDTFSPPVIYFNPANREFTVTPPEMQVREVAAVETPFEVELVAVQQEQYRIQLTGYAGSNGDYTAWLEVADTGKTELGRPGRVFDETKGNFTVKSFEVKRVTTNSNDSMPTVEDVGFAVILDGRSGREITLSTRERLMLARLQCVLRSRTYPPEQFTLREGMKCTVNGYDYLVLNLTINPAQATVSRSDPNSLVGEKRTLFPVGQTSSSAPIPAGEGLVLARQFHRLPLAFPVSE